MPPVLPLSCPSRSKRSGTAGVAPIAALTALVAALGLACASDRGAAQGATTRANAKAPAAPLQTEPVAIGRIDAPGLDVEDLTARLRDAFAAASGAPVVDEISVRKELAACTEAPCPEVLQQRFKAARFTMGARASKVGDSYLVSVLLLEGTAEIARVSQQGADPRAALAGAGAEIGALFRARVLAATPAPPAAPPPPLDPQEPAKEAR